jgi:hypothetical protein
VAAGKHILAGEVDRYIFEVAAGKHILAGEVDRYIFEGL